jgi:hypothetical protein
MLLRRKVPAEAIARTDAAAAKNISAAQISPGLLQNLLALASIGCCVAMAMPQVHLVSMCVDAGFGNAVGSRRNTITQSRIHQFTPVLGPLMTH